MKLLRYIVGFAIFLSGSMFGMIQSGSEKVKPSHKLELSRVIALIEASDRIEVEHQVMGPNTIKITDRKRSKPLKSDRWSESVEDVDFKGNLIKTMDGLVLSPSSYCFCMGQPSLKFIKSDKCILSMRVKHDEVIEFGDCDFNGYYTGKLNFTSNFYTLLKKAIHSQNTDEEALAKDDPACRSILAEITKAVFKQQDEVIRDAQKNLQIQPLPDVNIKSYK